MSKRSKKINLKDDEKLLKVNPKNLQYLRLYEMDMSQRNLSPKTINVYKLDLQGWFVYIMENQANQDVVELSEDELFDFFYYCKTQGNNIKRMKGRMSALSAFYKFLKKKKKLQKDSPMEFMDRPKDKGEKIVEQTFLTLEQVKLMVKKLDEYNDLQLKAYAMFSLDTMGRVNAVSNTKWSQIDWEECTVNDVLEKEGKTVDFFFSEDTKQLLLALKKQREENGIVNEYVFVTWYGKQYNKVSTSALHDWAKKIGKMIEVPSLHAHDFRHSGAQLLNLAGMPLEDISNLLNHEGVDVTRKHYLKQNKKKVQESKVKYKYL